MKNLSEPAAGALLQMGITALNPMQEKTYEAVMSGSDTAVISPSGTGKTLSYMLPVSERLQLQGSGRHYPAVMIIVPTRELADQTARVCRGLLAGREGIRTAVLCGGEDIRSQIRKYAKGTDIVIGTPSRLLDHIRRHTLKLKYCTTLVIDEADELMKMGFVDDTEAAASFLPPHQTIFLSATMDRELISFRSGFLNDPVIIEQQRKQKESPAELYCTVSAENRKLSTLRGILKRFPGPCYVFCNKKTTADFTAEALKRAGFRTAVVHSGMDMKIRRKAMQDFRDGLLDAVCSTDVLARGIDVPDTPLCIHYDVPESEDILIHRTGRTARAGKPGTCVFILMPKEKPYAAVIRRTLHSSVTFL